MSEGLKLTMSSLESGWMHTRATSKKQKNNEVIIMKVKQSLLPADYMTVYILCSYIIIAKFSVFRNICLSSSVKF